MTELLLQLGDERASAVDRLFPLVYDELKAVAAAAFLTAELRA